MSGQPSARLRADFWVSAYLRRCGVEDVVAVQRRRGSPEAGAIFIKIDRLDGTAALIGPAPQSEAEPDGERRFALMHKDPWVETPDVEKMIARELRFDSDLWLIEVEDRQGRSFLELRE